MSENVAIGVPGSILDTDLYKLTMQQAVLHHFPDVLATYRFTHRSKDVHFTKESIAEFQSAVSQFGGMALTTSERKWLEQTCPFFTTAYLEYLSSFRFKTEQVSITFVPLSDGSQYGDVAIEATGPWVETILWEIPLMSCLSEIFFRVVDTDWTYDGQADIAYQKAKSLLEAGCAFSEFGTRRRRSFRTQDLVIEQIIQAARDVHGTGKVTGTSNVHLAQKHGIAPVGTIAHEWFMGIAALKGYENANSWALDLWESVYHNSLLIALTDTFSTDAFFKNFTTDIPRAKRWQALRQDSGDPFAFAPRVKEVYERMGIDYTDKFLVFSDALDLEKALALKNQCDRLGIKSSFGIGTFLTNDFRKVSDPAEKSKALNMVIKLSSVNGKPCVKISDDLLKNTGDQHAVNLVKDIFGLPKV